MIEVTIPARKDHPARKYCKAAKLSTADISRYLDISYNTAWQIMVGDRPATQQQELKLHKLVAAIKAGTLKREETDSEQ